MEKNNTKRKSNRVQLDVFQFKPDESIDRLEVRLVASKKLYLTVLNLLMVPFFVSCQHEQRTPLVKNTFLHGFLKWSILCSNLKFKFQVKYFFSAT